MKKYFFRILLFTFGVILINTTIFFIVKEYYYKPYENIPEITSNDTVFIMADSHGGPLKQNLREHGIYNFSIGSDSYFDIYRKIIFLKKHHNVKKVLITADDHTLSFYREKLNNKDRSVYFLGLDDKDFLLGDKISIIKEKYFKRYIPLFNAKTTGIVERYFKSLFKDKKPKIYDWATNENKQKDSEKRAKKQFLGTESSESLKLCMTEIVKFCRENNIDIIAVKFPLAKDYLTEVNGRNFGADTHFTELGIKTYDFTEIYIDHDEYFANQDHLNDIGGEMFAKELLKIVEAD
jgi:hypothetical protein